MSVHIVFVHGMWSTPLVWNAWRAHFEHAGFTTEALTLPGHGVDEPDSALHGVGLRDCVAVVEQYVAQLDEPPVLIGHSLGGLVTQQVAARLPLAAAVLVCSMPPAPIFLQRPAVLSHLIRHFLRWQSWRKSFRLSRHEAGCLLFNAMDRDLGDALFGDMKAESGRIAWETSYGMLNWRGSNRVNRAAITCPLLALAGMQDHIIPLGVSRRMARWYGNKLDYREYAQHAHWMLDAEAGWEARAEEVCAWVRQQTRSD